MFCLWGDDDRFTHFTSSEQIIMEQFYNQILDLATFSQNSISHSFSNLTRLLVLDSWILWSLVSLHEHILLDMFC